MSVCYQNGWEKNGVGRSRGRGPIKGPRAGQGAMATCCGRRWTMSPAGGPCASQTGAPASPRTGGGRRGLSGRAPATRPFFSCCRCASGGSGRLGSPTGAGCGLSCLFCRCSVVCAHPLCCRGKTVQKDCLDLACCHCCTCQGSEGIKLIRYHYIKSK